MVAAPEAGRIFVQAGAFAVRENAQRVQSRIAPLGSAEIVPAPVGGGELYRVRLGPFRSRAEASQWLARILNSGYSQARIVVD